MLSLALITCNLLVTAPHTPTWFPVQPQILFFVLAAKSIISECDTGEKQKWNFLKKRLRIYLNYTGYVWCGCRSCSRCFPSSWHLAISTMSMISIKSLQIFIPFLYDTRSLTRVHVFLVWSGVFCFSWHLFPVWQLWMSPSFWDIHSSQSVRILYWSPILIKPIQKRVILGHQPVCHSLRLTPPKTFATVHTEASSHVLIYESRILKRQLTKHHEGNGPRTTFDKAHLWAVVTFCFE